MSAEEKKSKKKATVKTAETPIEVEAAEINEAGDETPKKKARKAASKKKGLTRAEHRRTHKRSKRFAGLTMLVERNKKYELADAIELAKKTSTVKFDASIDMHIHLQIDKSKPETLIRGTALLPHGTGKKLRVAAFVPADKEKEAKEAGAVLVGAQDLIDQIAKTGKTDFDIAVATPDMMKLMGKIARTLGQKGLMPSPKTETITTNPGKAIKELSSGKVSFKTDETGNIHQSIGKVSFDSAKITENFNSFLEVVKKGKPDSVKGTFVQEVVVASSMGPSIRVSFVA